VASCSIGYGFFVSPHHEVTKDKCKFILFIGEGSRFRLGKICKGLFENYRSQATWPLVRQCFEEHWLPHHGQPEPIRVDPAGVWRGEEADTYCRGRGISFTPIPAEAHWQVGIVENAIKAVKYVMTSLAEEFKDMSMQELFSRSLWACNPRDNQCGLCSMPPAEHQMSGVACLKVSFIITQFIHNG
jgi:hypothetical protein